MKDVFYLFIYQPQRFFHLQIMGLNFFFQRMVIEMLFNNKIQIIFYQNEFNFYFLNYTFVYIIEANL